VSTAQGATLRAKVDVASGARRGDQVGLAFDAAAVSLFDASSGRALRTARDDRPHTGRRQNGNANANGARHG
jgi:multiple sugar transport system ATP-binding protein